MVLATPPRLVVVTGAAGFIGREVCLQLRARGSAVRGLVRDLDGETALHADTLPIGDLATISDERLAYPLRDAASVVHLAARVHRARAAAFESLAAYRAVNVAATERVARAAAASGVRHFIFASSVKVNGEETAPGRSLTESDPPDPRDDYATSKWEAECALAAVAETTGMRVTALRLPLTYGPGAKANFARLARGVRLGVPLPLAGIDNRRSLLGIGNLGDALAALLADDTTSDAGRMTRYLLADAAPVSTPELVREIAAALGVQPRLVRLPASLLHFAGACIGRSDAVRRLTESLAVDTTAFRTRFGWTPPFTLGQGLRAALRPPAPL